MMGEGAAGNLVTDGGGAQTVLSCFIARQSLANCKLKGVAKLSHPFKWEGIEEFYTISRAKGGRHNRFPTDFPVL